MPNATITPLAQPVPVVTGRKLFMGARRHGPEIPHELALRGQAEYEVLNLLRGGLSCSPAVATGRTSGRIIR